MDQKQIEKRVLNIAMGSLFSEWDERLSELNLLKAIRKEDFEKAYPFWAVEDVPGKDLADIVRSIQVGVLYLIHELQQEKTILDPEIEKQAILNDAWIKQVNKNIREGLA
jgi:hypothetical protein